MAATLAPCPPEQGSVTHAQPSLGALLLTVKEGHRGIATQGRLWLGRRWRCDSAVAAGCVGLGDRGEGVGLSGWQQPVAEHGVHTPGACGPGPRGDHAAAFVLPHPQPHTAPHPSSLRWLRCRSPKRRWMATLLEEAFSSWCYQERTLPVWESLYKLAQLVYKQENRTKIICDEILKHEVLLERLSAATFDVPLADPLAPSGVC